MKNDVLEKLFAGKIIAIIRGVAPDKIQKTVEALISGGINQLEITYDQTSKETVKNTLDSLCKIKETFGDSVYLGAGTVITSRQAKDAAEAGAEYIISPNTDEKVIYAAKAAGCVSIPGVLTPSEAVAAHNAGADIIKLFPAGILGAGYLKALRGPLDYLKYLAVGGINENNAADFLRAGACGVGVGGNLVNLNYVRNNEFNKITEIAKIYIENLSGN